MSSAIGRATVRALLLALLGALVLGAAGALLALRDYPRYEAGVQLRLLADPEVGDEVERAAAAEDASFVATELVTLNGPDLEAAVRRRTGDPRLVVVAVRVGTANVVDVAVRSGRPDVVRAAEEVTTTYVSRRRAELLARIGSTGTEVDRQLRAAAAEITRLGELGDVTAQVQRAALTAEYTRLIEQRNTLQLASDASDKLIQVVTPADVNGARQIVSPTRDGALGAALGALAGAALAVGIGRLRNRVSGLEDLLRLSPDIALPTMPHLDYRRLSYRAGRAASAYVSALTAPGQSFGRPPIVVVGPTAGCGATVMAVGLAVASARRGPTIFLAADDAAGGASSLLGVPTNGQRPTMKQLATAHENLTYVCVSAGKGEAALVELEQRIARGLLAEVLQLGGAVVVDAPPLTRSSAALEMARQSGQVLLVGGLDRTTAVELDAAARAVRRVGARLVGVVLNATRGGSWRHRGVR